MAQASVILARAARAAAICAITLSLSVATNAHAQGLPPLAKTLKPAETALILVDYQYPFTNPAGGNLPTGEGPDPKTDTSSTRPWT